MNRPTHPHNTMPRKFWYQDGLRFECTQCGNCCTGEPGNVWLTPHETARLAERLGLSLADFERDYTEEVGVRRSLLERDNGDCVILDAETRLCRAYEDRPRQCATWPFWESNIATPEAWEETCRVCPGSGQGPLVPLSTIRERAKVIRL